jgi:hypothetical protein
MFEFYLGCTAVRQCSGRGVQDIVIENYGEHQRCLNVTYLLTVQAPVHAKTIGCKPQKVPVWSVEFSQGATSLWKLMGNNTN